VRDFEKYRVDPLVSLMPDFFVPDDISAPDALA
jgi:citronellol/citronellal dehydrogenase